MTIVRWRHWTNRHFSENISVLILLLILKCMFILLNFLVSFLHFKHYTADLQHDYCVILFTLYYHVQRTYKPNISFDIKLMIFKYFENCYNVKTKKNTNVELQRNVFLCGDRFYFKTYIRTCCMHKNKLLSNELKIDCK